MLITVNELADKLRVNPITVRRLVYSEKIPYLRIGSSLRFDYDEVIQFFKEGNERANNGLDKSKS
jgi:excisionase family DNA binding protein